MKDVISLVEEKGILPIMFAENPADTAVVIPAIEQTDIPAVEILQRGDKALQMLKDAVKLRKNAYIGAGSVRNLEMGKQMLDNGADFIVSPGFDRELVAYCVKNNVPIIPGVMTPSEIMMAVNEGVRLAKFFPYLLAGGEPYLTAISSPFPNINFIVTGNIDERHFGNCFQSKRIAAIGGVWMFCTEQNHTLYSPEKIIAITERSIRLAKEYRD